MRFKRFEVHGTLLLPKGIQKVVEVLISNARVYFRADATQHILNEARYLYLVILVLLKALLQVRPLLCQYDSIFPRGLLIANLFLPTMLSPEEHKECGASLWFGVFINFFFIC